MTRQQPVGAERDEHRPRGLRLRANLAGAICCRSANEERLAVSNLD